jgi:nucleotide-binding universal stress UspA family protein
MNILCATDLLTKSDASIDRAGFLADSVAARLTVLHAVPADAPGGSTLEQRVRRAESRLAARVSAPSWRWVSQPQIAVRCGHAARVVLDVAYRQMAGLVVLGPHRVEALADAVSGTITEKVLGAAACPVLIAREHTEGHYRHVLVALDGTSRGGDIVQALESLGLTRESRATIVHAHEPMYVGMMNVIGVGAEAASAYADSSRAQAAIHLEQLIRKRSEDPRRFEIVVVEQPPAAAILRAIDAIKPGLVVLGTRGHGRFRRALLGSTASDVLRAAHGDVLLVPDRSVRAGYEGHRDAARTRGASVIVEAEGSQP